MKLILKAALGAGLIALAACGSKTDDAADNVRDNAEAVADNIEAAGDNMSNEAASDAADNQADAVRAAGENKADAIEEGNAAANQQ